MNTNQLRQTFLDYFQEHGHTIVPSSSLIPVNDQTLLFTNAGMVQFKDVFLGLEQRPYLRAASSQRCVRAGGKHNDLENVGFTARHHTFFEMLGNFSFGDYFKREAIHFAWRFLTQVLGLSPKRLWVTVFEKDNEAEDIWLQEIKVDPKRFSRCGMKDNFWAMGDTGPCGPCTEIFYDHGPEVFGGPPGSKDAEGDRYIEIWNLVFMQYNKDTAGNLHPLPKPSVDTGMGLERIAAVMQGVHSNYDIDIFKNLINRIAELGKLKNPTGMQKQSLQVLADHIRSCSFLIADGVFPSNEGRGYVLRRIIRRAIRHGYQLGFKIPFFHKFVAFLAIEMGDPYPELRIKQARINDVLLQEELQFERTLEQGLKILAQTIAEMSDGTVILGETVFRLYDTYGFPVDLTADIARGQGLSLDMEGFNKAMEAQKTRARKASQFSADYSISLAPTHTAGYSTDFVGYQRLEEKSKVVALYQEGNAVSELKTDAIGAVVLDHTPFYAESGGQVGDQGVLRFSAGLFEVKNTKKVGEAYLHYGLVKEGFLKSQDTVLAAVDKETRYATALNHSATHLLHAALRQIVGSHVQQKGSLVEPLRLRFDFSHAEPLTLEQMQKIEKLVNEKIRDNSVVATEIMSVDRAINSGAVALFGEKYGKEVRVLQMGGNFSVELCGGTHVQRTGDIGLFKITAEYGVAAGIRRLEAITGERALEWGHRIAANLDRIGALLKCRPESIEEKVQQLIAKTQLLEKDLQQLKAKLATGKGVDLTEQILEVKGIPVLAAKLPVGDLKTLRETIDRLKSQLRTAVIVLAGVDEQHKINLIAGVTADCTDKIQANSLVNYVAKQVGGQGGGRVDMAQAGGNQPGHLDAALNSVYKWVEEKL
jgi:alanyl-tRNA synthetase